MFFIVPYPFKSIVVECWMMLNGCPKEAPAICSILVQHACCYILKPLFEHIPAACQPSPPQRLVHICNSAVWKKTSLLSCFSSALLGRVCSVSIASQRRHAKQTASANSHGPRSTRHITKTGHTFQTLSKVIYKASEAHKRNWDLEKEEQKHK